MIRSSAITAIALAIGLAVAELLRNWGDWQWWPFWLVVYVASAFHIAGGVALFISALTLLQR
ncbi:MAG: hypothetical protein AAGB02_08185 [Pseudomonadota bacterium]